MAEFVQECSHFTEGQQRGLAMGGAGEIHGQRYQGADIVAHRVAILLAEGCHPGTTLLGLAREKVGV